MKNVLIVLIVLIGLQGCISPKQSNNMSHDLFPEFKGKYRSFLGSDETELKTHYHTMLSKKQDGSFVFRQFFPETMTLTKLTTFRSDQETKHGYSSSYSDDGVLRSEGHFLDGLQDGYWLGPFSGVYKNGKKEGEWIETNKEGQVVAKYQYKNNIKEGPFVVYDSLGQILNEGIYHSDTIHSQSKFVDKIIAEKLMPMMVATQCDHLPYPEKIKCSEKAILEYIYKTIRYPAQARINGVHGNAIVQFSIDVDGSIQDIYVINGLCQSIKDEVIRVVRSFPKWIPGYTNGKPIKFKYTLPVKFTLGK